jgi:hypothetical protein
VSLIGVLQTVTLNLTNPVAKTKGACVWAILVCKENGERCVKRLGGVIGG